MDAIYVRDLIKRYKTQVVLRGVNLRIKEGEFYALMGPNGSGKSTLAGVIASVLTPSSGKVEVFGRAPKEARDMMGYLPQKNFSSPFLTGLENFTYITCTMGYSTKDARKLAEKNLKRVGIWDDASKLVSKYSGGMRRLLEIATVFLPGTKLLILDEPTTGLDPNARSMLFEMVKEAIRRDNTTVFMITHIGSDADFASRVGFMNEGRIIAEGSPEELKRKSGLKGVLYVEPLKKSPHVLTILRELGEGSVLETDSGYRIYCDSPEELVPKITRALNNAGVKIRKMETSGVTLEDVFFKFTGRRMTNNGSD